MIGFHWTTPWMFIRVLLGLMGFPWVLLGFYKIPMGASWWWGWCCHWWWCVWRWRGSAWRWWSTWMRRPSSSLMCKWISIQSIRRYQEYLDDSLISSSEDGQLLEDQRSVGLSSDQLERGRIYRMRRLQEDGASAKDWKQWFEKVAECKFLGTGSMNWEITRKKSETWRLII